jgi:heat shock protein HslJ
VRHRLLTGIALITVSALATACGDDGGASIEGTEWVLATIDGEGLPESVAPTLLLADGTASGNAGCNQFTGGYTLDGDQLTFGPLATTRMACVPEVDEIEQAYLARLSSVADAATTDDGLELSDADGEVVLTYVGP